MQTETLLSQVGLSQALLKICVLSFGNQTGQSAEKESGS